MRRSHYFIVIVISFLFMISFSSCYTTFHMVKKAEPAEEYYYSGTGEVDEYDEYYEDSYDVEPTHMQFTPSRFVVTKRYYDYGGYIRKVKFVAYEEPWYDPYYYDSPQIYINLHFGFGYYFPPRRWHRVTYYPDIYFAWTPYPIWYDPWYCTPVYYPVYYPIPVHYPAPVYYPPPVYYAGHKNYYRNYKKRDWNRRQPKDGRRIARRGSDIGKRQSPDIVRQTRSDKISGAERRQPGRGRKIKGDRNVDRDSGNSARRGRPTIRPTRSSEDSERRSNRTIRYGNRKNDERSITRKKQEARRTTNYRKSVRKDTKTLRPNRQIRQNEARNSIRSRSVRKTHPGVRNNRSPDSRKSYQVSPKSNRYESVKRKTSSRTYRNIPKQDSRKRPAAVKSRAKKNPSRSYKSDTRKSRPRVSVKKKSSRSTGNEERNKNSSKKRGNSRRRSR